MKRRFQKGAARGVFAALCVAACVPAFAEAEPAGDVATVRVRGEHRLTLDSEESPKEALFGARNDARRRAIREVLGERVASWETLFTHDAGQVYSGTVLTSAVGVVRDVRELRRGWEPSADGVGTTVFYEAEIAVERKAEEADPEFTAEIRGGKSRYVHGEEAAFAVTASREAFLTVLWLNQDFQADAVCSAKRLAAGEAAKLEMIFEIASARAKKEAGTLFFVLTKRPRAFLRAGEAPADLERNLERVEAWLAAIPLRERFIYAVPFVIERERRN